MKRRGVLLAALVAGVSAAGLSVAVLAAPGAGRPATAAVVGNWLGPFEEGGDATPLCTEVPSAGPYLTELVCKPTAVTSVPLYDGRVLFWNGVEGSENVVENAVLEGGRVTRDDQSRVVDLSGATAAFTVPVPERGGAVNPQIALGESPDDPWANDGGLFCSDQIQLADGRILAAGGTDFYDRAPGQGALADPADFLPIPPDAETIIELEGLRNARIFDPATDTWTQTGHMSWGRWYPQLVTLPDGKVFVASGVKLLIQNTTNDVASSNGQVRLTEVFDPETGVWTPNDTAKNEADTLESLPLFPRMHLAPNGKIYFGGVGQTFGPMGQDPQQSFWGLNRFYNLQTKSWELVVPGGSSPHKTEVRGGAFQIALQMQPPYDELTLLIGGGTLGPTPGDEVANDISERVTIDSSGTVTRDLTAGQLNNPRWFSSAQILPTGEVIAFSGATRDEVVNPGSEAPVHVPELYDPATDSWTELAPTDRDRTYHNTAVLLADGRILVGGHSPIPNGYTFHQQQDPSLGLANNFKDPSFEVFEPPYLFRGPRPNIEYAPAKVAWGSDFKLEVDDPDSIESVVLISLPSQTHVVDSDLRSLRLDFERVEGIAACAPRKEWFWTREPARFTAAEYDELADYAASLSEGYFADGDALTAAVRLNSKLLLARAERQYGSLLLNFAAAELSGDMSFTTGLSPSSPVKPSVYGGATTAAEVAGYVRSQLPSGNRQAAVQYARSLNRGQGLLCERGIQRGVVRLLATAPPDGLAAPPGPYYLFVNRTTPDGPTPSVASVVFIGETSAVAAAAEPLQDSSAAASSGSASPIPADRSDLTD